MWTLNNGSGFKSQNCTWFHPLPTTPLELPLGEKTPLLSSKGQIERGWWESLKLTSLIIKLLFFTGILRDTWSPNIYVIASWIDLQNCWKIFPLSFFAVLGLPCQAISLAIPVWEANTPETLAFEEGWDALRSCWNPTKWSYAICTLDK